jgi:L-threonine kinase
VPESLVGEESSIEMGKSSLKSEGNSNVKLIEWQGAAVCPGSCGELVQGTWNGVNFLIPCPINLYSLARVTLRPGSAVSGPTGRSKATAAVRKILDFLGHQDLGGELTIQSEIPTGKGMASSTADIGAAILATSSALGVSIKPRDLARLAISIEPTDGTLLPGITLLDHVRGQWILPLGVAPAAQILVVDPGGEVDTLQFNSLPQLSNLNRINEPITRQAFHLVRRGIQERNLHLLGEGTTLSAEANQSILGKNLLPELKRWGKQRGCQGIIAAHSGTVLGMIYPHNLDLGPEEAELRRVFPEIANVWKVRLIPGGVKQVPTSDKNSGRKNIKLSLPNGREGRR